MGTKMATLERFSLFRLGAVALGLYAGTVSFAFAADPHGVTAPVVLAQADPDAAPDDAQSAAGLLIRIERLEDRIRSMTGQLEQLQFQNKKLEDALRKMQQDVDFRFQDLGRGAQPGAGRSVPQKRTDAGTGADQVATDDAALPETTPTPAARSPRRASGDAFNPEADPNAPGAPRPLGTTPPSEPLTPRTATPRRSAAVLPDAGEPHAPMNLVPPAAESSTRVESTVPRSSVASAEPSPAAAPEPRVSDAPAGVASLVPGGTRSEYDSLFGLYKSGQYDAAANGFQSFLTKYPRDRLAGDATYFLGESYARLGRHREAAEQFLKLSTDYKNSTHAPDALLRLGIALNALGAKEQACATYQEVDRKFPSASADVRAGVERELKRAKC